MNRKFKRAAFILNINIFLKLANATFDQFNVSLLIQIF